MGTAGADPSGTAQSSTDVPQTFFLETDQGNKVAVYDFRPQLWALHEKDLEKACFLVLSRVYSVFSPAKLADVTSLMAKNKDHVSLICAVTHKYLQYEAASALITALVADLRSGARTEEDWHVDLELASIRRSCSWIRKRRTLQVIQLGIRPLRRLMRRSQPHTRGGGSSTDRPPLRDRTRSAQADRSKRKPERQACLFPCARATDTPGV